MFLAVTFGANVKAFATVSVTSYDTEQILHPHINVH